MMPDSLRKFDKPWLAALLATLCFAGFLFAFCAHRHNFSASQFVYAGNKFCDPNKVPKNLIVMDNDGFDGEFFYRLALNPFTHQATEYGITIDAPPYRQQRIFYPLLAYVLDLGNPLNAPRSLVLLNLLAIAGITYVSALYARERGLHALWGLLAGLNAGFFVTIQRDTSELVSLFLALLGMRLFGRRRYAVSSFVFVLAMLTRETTLVVPAAIIVQMLAARLPFLRAVMARTIGQAMDDNASIIAGSKKHTVEKGRWELVWFLVPFAAYGCWQVFLTHLWGVSPWTFSGGRLTIPFAGIRELLTSGGGPFGAANLPIAVSQIFLIVYGVIAVGGDLRESKATITEKLSWAVYALMALSYTYMIYLEDYDFMRTIADYFAFSALVLYGASRKTRWQFLLVLLAVDLIQGYAFIYHR